MKKTLLFLTVISVFMFVACSGNNKSTLSDIQNNATTASADSSTTTTLVKDSATENGSEANVPLVMDFNATWCGPCKMFAPIFKQAAEAYNGKIKFLSIDIDEQPDMAKRYNVEAVPTLVFCNKEGMEVNRIVGAPSSEEFTTELQKLLH